MKCVARFPPLKVWDGAWKHVVASGFQMCFGNYGKLEIRLVFKTYIL
jgi:hypothetical protein